MFRGLYVHRREPYMWLALLLPAMALAFLMSGRTQHAWAVIALSLATTIVDRRTRPAAEFESGPASDPGAEPPT